MGQVRWELAIFPVIGFAIGCAILPGENPMGNFIHLTMGAWCIVALLWLRGDVPRHED